MALMKVKNVRITGMSAGVPKNVIRNLEIESISEDYDSKAFVEATGVVERHVSDVLTTSDLCVPAAEKLISDLNWSKYEIDAIIFVSQTSDYLVPATSCIIQDKLGLSKECFAEDINLGCSGWVYGLSNAASLIQNGCLKKALLMVGDAKRRYETGKDPLFGCAGTVTALEFDEDAPEINFHFGTDGSGYDAIIIPDMGSRNGISLDSFTEELVDGKMLSRLETHMKGMDVFSFGITTAPKSIKKLAKYVAGEEAISPWLDYDFYVFHQANMKMNQFIVKKLKLPEDKVPYSMPHFGNTSSASIPLTIVTQLKDKVENSTTKYMCCGFGVGLSWGTVAFETKQIVISDLVEVE